jgi:hypothetical protein
MIRFRLALVEDNEEDIQTCKDSVSRYQDEKHRDIELVVYRSVDEALQKLDKSFDGAIVDLRFDTQGDEGNQVVSRIAKSNLRIPTVIMTGTPSSVDTSFDFVWVFKKGETEYVDILNKFWEIHDTGLTRIMGGRGTIEKTLNEVFQKNMIPQIEAWVKHGKINSTRTEKALLRHILGHLLQLLEDDADACFPEEFYIRPQLTVGHKTGSIVRNVRSSSFFVVLTPACDLVVRSTGDHKTDRILLAEIEPDEAVTKKALDGYSKKDKKENRLKDVFGNNYTMYYHWLPRTEFFQGGFLNFRKLTAIKKNELVEAYESPEVQISPFFVKDIVARFLYVLCAARTAGY